MVTRFDRLVLAKNEATKGTDAVPVVGSDAVRVVSANITSTPTIIERPVVKQTMGNVEHLIGKETVSLEIVVEARGSGALGVAPEWSPLMLACRTVETIVASTSVTYSPSTATENTATIYFYKDGLLWKFVGATGTVTIDASIDALVTMTFTMQAAYTAPTAVTVPTGAVYQAVQPLVLKSADVFNDGSVIKVGAFAFDAGNDVQNHYTTGENSFVVADRNPTVTFTKDSINTTAEWNALSAGTNVAFSATIGQTAANIMTFTAPVMKRSGVGYSERAERDTLDLTYNLFESSSDDQYSIQLT